MKIKIFLVMVCAVVLVCLPELLTFLLWIVLVFVGSIFDFKAYHATTFWQMWAANMQGCLVTIGIVLAFIAFLAILAKIFGR